MTACLQYLRHQYYITSLSEQRADRVEKGLISWVDHKVNNYDLFYIYAYITYFLYIKILVFVIKIMAYQFFKINYILFGVIMEAIQIIFWKKKKKKTSLLLESH